MTKRQDLYLQRRSRPEQSDQRQPNQAANISHQSRASPNSTPLASRIEFPTMTAATRPSRPPARRILRRLEFHYVPKHASWLNMVEIEIGVLRGQCLDRRLATPERLVSEIAAWERQRNATRARVKWMFTTEKARAKMGRAYPEPASIKAHQTMPRHGLDRLPYLTDEPGPKAAA